MSFLRQLPEFVSGEPLARLGKWSAAKTDFSRCIDIMSHAKSARDGAICRLYAATCSYFGGNLGEAKSNFDVVSNESALGESDPIRTVANRYSFSTSLMSAPDAVSVQKLLYRGKGSGDLWVQFSAGLEPPAGSYARKVWEFQHTGSCLEAPQSNSNDKIAYTYALIADAERDLEQLPPINIDNTDVSNLVDRVTKALRSSESIGKDASPDLGCIGKFYISRSLILRARLFQFNGNALMAEAMYRAAIDVAESEQTPRLSLVSGMSKHHLGKLLSKWERREREGEQLIEENPTSERTEKLVRIFVAEPTLDELGKLA